MKRVFRVASVAMTLLGATVCRAVTVECDDSGDPAIKFAADDLVRYLKNVDGRIVLKVDPSLAAQAWRFRSDEDGVLVISGRDGMGISYGVSTFLEKYAGIAWLAPDTEIVPDLKDWTVPMLDESGALAFIGREMYVGKDLMDSVWRLRNKETKRAACGVGVREGRPGDCHTFAAYTKPLRAAHPELFGKKRNRNGAICYDLCMTDPLVREFVADEMCRNIEADLQACAGKPAYVRPMLYDLSQNDGGSGYECYCDGCRARCEAAGSYAGPNAEFVSAVADRVATRHPEVRIQTFAYSYTSEPPTNEVRMADNVQLRFVAPTSLFDPFLPGTKDGDWLLRWSRHCSHFGLWSYWRTYGGVLYPFVKPRRNIRDELRFCRKLGVDRYFAEDEAPLSRSFAMHQHWLFLKMTEDPTQDIMALSKKFFIGYYGAAARPLAEYLNHLERVQEKTFAYLNREFFEKANAWLDEAERLVADDERHLRHVRWERVVLDRALYDRLGALTKEGYVFDKAKVAARFAANTKDQLVNWPGFKWQKEMLAERLKKAECEADLYAHYPIPLPSRFEGLQVEPIEWFNLRPGDSELVSDPDAAAGMAFRSTQAEMSLPYAFGYYNTTCRFGDAASYKTKADVPQDEKYHLVRICRSIIGGEQFFYYDRAWLSRVYLPTLGIVPSEWEVWLSVKFQGPAFVEGSTRENAVLFDRALFVKNDDPTRGYDRVGGNLVPEDLRRMEVRGKDRAWSHRRVLLGDPATWQDDLLVRGRLSYANVRQANSENPHPFLGLWAVTADGKNDFCIPCCSFFGGTYENVGFETVIEAERIRRCASASKGVKPLSFALRLNICGQEGATVRVEDLEAVPLRKQVGSN